MATQSDLSQLLDMGFDKERAEIAVKKSGGLHGALEWLENTQDKPLDELLAQDKTAGDAAPPADEAVANSMVCKECGKKFRGQTAAEIHASKSGHVDFEESTEELAPLTEEEKAARLAEMKAKLAEKRAGMSEQDKLDKKRNEEIRRKSTKETQDMKEDLKKKEQLKDAAKKRQEKLDDMRAKDAIKAKIQADKEARRLKAEQDKAAREGRAAEAAPAAAPVAAAPAGAVTSKPASAYTETRLRLQTASGNVMKTLPVETTLFEVAQALQTESGVKAQSFVQNFPKKTFGLTEYGATLKELGLIPSASLIVK